MINRTKKTFSFCPPNIHASWALFCGWGRGGCVRPRASRSGLLTLGPMLGYRRLLSWNSRQTQVAGSSSRPGASPPPPPDFTAPNLSPNAVCLRSLALGLGLALGHKKSGQVQLKVFNIQIWTKQVNPFLKGISLDPPSRTQIKNLQGGVAGEGTAQW